MTEILITARGAVFSVTVTGIEVATQERRDQIKALVLAYMARWEQDNGDKPVSSLREFTITQDGAFGVSHRDVILNKSLEERLSKICETRWPKTDMMVTAQYLWIKIVQEEAEEQEPQNEEGIAAQIARTLEIRRRILSKTDR